MPTALQIVKAFFPQVEKVVDGTKRITVHVSESDSKKSTQRNHSNCALATACKNQEHADGVIVSVKTAYIVKGNRAFRYRNLESTSREIVSFDRAAGFAPGDYQLAPMGKSHLLGADKDGKRSLRKGGKSVASMFQHRTTDIRTSLSSSLEVTK